MPDPITASTVPSRGRRQTAVAVWLLVCGAMVYAMVVLGGVTRLTESGLSMVDWRPLMGILPPLGEAEWIAVFERYKQSPEYQIVNRGMTVEGFRSIFWMEYIHRVWGRLIGVAFLVPFLYFLIRRRISRALAPKLVVLFVLGALQGLLGWYMVKSGLVRDPTVSQYRLTAHLGVAIAIYGFMLWVALDLLTPRQRGPAAGSAGLSGPAAALTWLIFFTALTGGFVAGLDAGLSFNTFPLMAGQLIPDGLFMLSPLHLNFFENSVTVQFTHRVAAIATAFLVIAFWLRAGRTLGPGRARPAAHFLLAAAAVQVALGISTLVLEVPVPLAVAHQAGALALFTAAIWISHELRVD